MHNWEKQAKILAGNDSEANTHTYQSVMGVIVTEFVICLV